MEYKAGMTRLEAMKAFLEEIDKSQAFVTQLADELKQIFNLKPDYSDECMSETEVVIAELRKQVKLGEDYTRPYTPYRPHEAKKSRDATRVAIKTDKDAAGWCEEHATNYFGDRCNFGEHRRKL